MEFVIESAPVGHRISLGFLRKSINTLRSVRLLAREGLFEECQILTRAVFELRVTFECFVRMLQENPSEACHRVIDAMMLGKIKQLESVDYYPDAPADIRPSREEWEKEKLRIVDRYPSAEIAAMSRHGFTGISIEER